MGGFEPASRQDVGNRKPGGGSTPAPGKQTLTERIAPAQPAPALPATAPANPAVTDTPRVESANLLHAEEIFADVPANTDAKKHAFNRLSQALRTQRQAEQAAAHANASAKVKAQLQSAQAEVAAATEALKTFVVTSRLKTDPQLRDLKKQLAATDAKQHGDEVAEIKQAITTREAAIRGEVTAMTHSELGHEQASAFAPVATDITHHDFAFPDGEHVKVRDHVVSYATTSAAGVDSEGAIDHAQVTRVMGNAGLSASRRKILQAISGFEGGFDTVNTYDRAKVTWGFVQWTGGDHSDLTQALTIIKQQHPDAFASQFQAYGIDLVANQIVITPSDGSPPRTGDAAADAILRDPRLAAILAHAGRNEDVQQGEVQAASELEIQHALDQQVQFGHGKHKVTTTAGALITSEYGVGLLANTFVHSGSGAARVTLHAAIAGYLPQHPYVADNEIWRAGAEAAILQALAARDGDRAAALSQQLSHDAGSFQ